MKIIIHPTFGTSGYRYKVTMDDVVLVERSRTPVLDACRALQGLAKFGKVEVWRECGSHPCMIADVERHARRTVTENEKVSPRFAKYSEFKLPEPA